jgi:hypothetical protein
MWSVVNMEVDGLVIRHVTIDSRRGGNRDGIDVVDCHDVLIEDCKIASADDSICLKSGAARGVRDVTVRNCRVLESGVANGLKLGTASYGAFRNVTFESIDVKHADKAAMPVESVDGASVEDVVFRDITFEDVGSPFFVLLGDRGLRPSGVPRRIGTIDGVRFERVRGSALRHDWGGILSGLLGPEGVAHPISNVTFSDVTVTVLGGAGSVPADPPEYAGQYPDPNLWGRVPASAVFVRHAQDVTFAKTSFTEARPDARHRIDARDVARLTYE